MFSFITGILEEKENNLLDKQTNKLYESKPENLTKADTLTVYYSGSLGTPTKYGNYNYSINYEKQHRYAIRCVDNSIEVLYLLGGKVKIDYTDFPQLLDQEKFEINIVVGEYDAPSMQSQYLLTVPFSTDGNVLLYGATGSGKENFISTLIYSSISFNSSSSISRSQPAPWSAVK